MDKPNSARGDVAAQESAISAYGLAEYGAAWAASDRVLIAVHGRDRESDELAIGFLSQSISRTTRIVAPYAPGKSWYGGRYDAPYAENAEAVEAGLRHPRWPARLEVFTMDEGRLVLLDAAHNADGAAALAEYIRQWHPEGPALVFGVMQDKDVNVMLRTLLPVASRLIATAAPSPRAMPPEELARRAADVAAALRAAVPGARTVAVSMVADPEAAIRSALAVSNVVCVAGSIFLAGAVRDSLERRALVP